MRLLLVCVALPVVALASPARTRSAPADTCLPLPTLRSDRAFRPGEELDFSLDAMGAQAGTLSLRVLPLRDGQLPIRAEANSNTFFSKIRRVHGVGTSYLDPQSLRPVRYVEDSLENDVHRTADVHFGGNPRQVGVAFSVNGALGHRTFHAVHDALDAAGAIFLMRQLPLHVGAPLCFEAYGIRRLWRVTGRVEAREHLSLPLGEFDAWHIAGEAVRVDDPRQHREVHVWISDDARRLPLVAVGSIDLGAVRATLTRYARPGERVHVAQPARDLSW